MNKIIITVERGSLRVSKCLTELEVEDSILGKDAVLGGIYSQLKRDLDRAEKPQPPPPQSVTHLMLSAGVYACGKMSPPILSNSHNIKKVTCVECLKPSGRKGE